MRRILVIILLAFFVMSFASSSIAGAQDNSTGNKTDSSTATLVETKSNETGLSTGTEEKTKEQKFRVGPTVRIQPLNSEINRSADGVVEVILNNPSLNDVTLEVDMKIDVPQDVYITAEEGGMSGGAGTVIGHYSVASGLSRKITLLIKGEKVGTFPVHFSVNYWPGNNKDKWNTISLDNSFEVKEPTPIPKNEPTSESDSNAPKVPGLGVLSLVFILMIAFILKRK